MKIDFSYQGAQYTLSGPDGDYIARRVESEGTFYELELLEDLRAIPLPASPLIVDVGANIGNHTLFFASVMGGTVIAVEPEPGNVDTLRDNVRANGIEDRVTVHPFALGQGPGRGNLVQMIPDNAGTFAIDVADDGAVEVRTLDSIVGKRDKVALIKIDVEGFELEVLRGARRTLESHHPVIAVECHSGDHFAALCDFLTPYGYVVIDITGRSDNFTWVHEASIGELRLRNVREGLELRRVRRQFRQVFTATDRISNLLRNSDKKGDAWRVQADQALAAAAVGTQAIPEFRSALQGALAALSSLQASLPAETGQVRADVLRELARHAEEQLARQMAVADSFRTVGGELRGALDHALDAQSAELTRALEDLNKALDAWTRDSRGLLEELLPAIRHAEHAAAAGLGALGQAVSEGEARTRDGLEDLGQRVVAAIAAGEARSHEGVAGGVQRVVEAVTAAEARSRDGMAELGQAVSGSADMLGRTIGRVKDQLAAAVERRHAGHATRELELADLVRKLLDSEEQHRALTQELLQAKSDLQRFAEAAAATKREVLTRDLAIREWEGAYELLHGSRAMRAGRSLRKMFGFARAPYDVPARRADIAAAVANYLSQAPVADGALPLAGLHEVRKSRRQGREPIRAGVATMPGREDGLAVVLASIAPQVDEVFVYLNGFDVPPACVFEHDNVRAFIGPDVGDRGKFRFIDGFSGYFISVDDDIAYPRFYVQTLIDGIERYGRKAAVGWHGSLLLEEFVDYYDPKSRRVLTFGSERGADTQVHILGTGCTAFHTDTIRISYGDFLKPNMADIFFALEGQRQGVPFVVLSHRKGWAKPIEFKNSPSISGESMKSSGSKIDVRGITNWLVKTQGAWRKPPLPDAPPRPGFKLALIGRTDKDRWKKGGILKSSHLTKEMLDPYGIQTNLVDLELGDVEGLGGQDADIVMIYPGDPDRPDYRRVEYLVDFHAAKGRVVLVNLSLNGVVARSRRMADRMLDWRSRYGNLVWLMTFTERARDVPELAPVRDAIAALPKTVEVPPAKARSFSDTDGIFLGDYGKLCDDGLLGVDPVRAIAALRDALPGVRLFCVKQYRPKADRDLGIEILPYLEEDYSETLRKSRLMVSLVKYATFEMVPLELAGMGIPILHPRMEFSLSDYLGLSSFEFAGIEEMVRTATLLYRDPMAWDAASQSGALRANSADFRKLSAQMYIQLLALSRHARKNRTDQPHPPAEVHR